ncbi:MAG: hypothetical protein R3Y53_07650 [Bacillota bacterium]
MDLSTGFIADLITASCFGETGSSFVLDANNNILGHETESLISQNYTALNLSGDIVDEITKTPTGALVEFEVGGTKRIGTVGMIGSDGWKIVTSLGSDEFYAKSDTLVYVLFVLLVISTLMLLGMAAFIVQILLKPMSFIKTAMHELARGNTHYEFDYESNNEIGELADNLRFTMKNLAMYIDEIKYL